MNNTNKILSVVFAALVVILVSCSKDNLSTSMSAANGSADKAAASTSNGHLYSMTNDASQNAVIEFTSNSDGTYSLTNAFNTGGKGTGAPLGSQGSIAIDQTNGVLYVVNAGDNTISSLKINTDGSLTLKYTVDSKGNVPVSLSLYNNWLYVVNYATANIEGFVVGTDGSFTHIMGSYHHLSTIGCQPAEIKFRPDGSSLYVTEKATNIITSFPVDQNGVAGTRTSIASAGETPFGFDFGANQTLLVSDAFGGTQNASALTAYATSTSGKANVVSGPIPDNQTAACWVAVPSDKHYALTTNTGSNTISLYKVTSDGNLSLFTQVAASTGAAPADIVIVGHYAYTVNQTGQSLGEFKINNDGTLTSVGEVFGLTAGVSGLAAD